MASDNKKPKPEAAPKKDAAAKVESPAAADAPKDALKKTRQSPRAARRPPRRLRTIAGAKAKSRSPRPTRKTGTRFSEEEHEEEKAIASVAVIPGRGVSREPRMIILQKTLRIDVDIELDRAVLLRRRRQPFAQVGRQIESARRFDQQPQPVPAAHQRERRFGGAEHAHVVVEKSPARRGRARGHSLHCRSCRGRRRRSRRAGRTAGNARPRARRSRRNRTPRGPARSAPASPDARAGGSADSRGRRRHRGRRGRPPDASSWKVRSAARGSPLARPRSASMTPTRLSIGK